MGVRSLIGRIALAAVLTAPLACTPSSNSSNSSTSSASTGATPTGMKAPSTAYVLTKDAVYYKNSPAQPMPADGTFREGTKVTLLKSMGSYKYVQSGDGTKAYVASDALQPAK